MVDVACCCGAGICAAVASAGVAVAVGLRLDSRFSSGSRFFRTSRFLVGACGIVDSGLAVAAVACGCSIEICAAVASMGIGIAVSCNGTGFSADVAVTVNSTGLSAGFAIASGRGVVFSVGFAVAMRGTAVVISFGATTDLWLASGFRDSRVSSGSRFSRASRFLAMACSIAGCDLAVLAVACGCGAGICTIVVSASIGVAMACSGAGLSAGFTMAMRGTVVVVSLGVTVKL